MNIKSITTKILILLIALLDAGYFFYLQFCYTFAETEIEKKFYTKVLNISLLGQAIVLMLTLFAAMLFYKTFDIDKDDNDDDD